jgi:hypothetical protein
MTTYRRFALTVAFLGCCVALGFAIAGVWFNALMIGGFSLGSAWAWRHV